MRLLPASPEVSGSLCWDWQRGDLGGARFGTTIAAAAIFDRLKPGIYTGAVRGSVGRLRDFGLSQRSASIRIRSCRPNHCPLHNHFSGRSALVAVFFAPVKHEERSRERNSGTFTWPWRAVQLSSYF